MRFTVSPSITVCRRSTPWVDGWLRTDVDNILILVEATLLCSNQVTILAQGVLHGEVILRLISARELVGIRAHIEVLAQWIALEICAEEKAATCLGDPRT